MVCLAAAVLSVSQPTTVMATMWRWLRWHVTHEKLDRSLGTRLIFTVKTTALNWCHWNANKCQGKSPGRQELCSSLVRTDISTRLSSSLSLSELWESDASPSPFPEVSDVCCAWDSISPSPFPEVSDVYCAWDSVSHSPFPEVSDVCCAWNSVSPSPFPELSNLLRLRLFDSSDMIRRAGEVCAFVVWTGKNEVEKWKHKVNLNSLTGQTHCGSRYM